MATQADIKAANGIIALTHVAIRRAMNASDEVSGQEIRAHHVCAELARHAYHASVSRTAIDAWSAKCAPEIDRNIAILDARSEAQNYL